MSKEVYSMKMKLKITENTVIMILFLFSTLMGCVNSAPVKLMVIILCLTELLIIILKYRSLKSFSYIEMWLWCIWSIWLLCNLMLNFTSSFLSICIQQISLLVLMFRNYRPETEQQSLAICSGFEKILFILLVADTLYFLKHGFSFYSVPILGMSLFGIYKSKNRKRYILILAMIMFVLKARSTFLSLIIMLLMTYIVGFFKKHKSAYNLFFLLTSISVVYIPKFYLEFYNSPYAMSANLFIRKYTGKNLFSGREQLWTLAYKSINSSKWFGYGAEYFDSAYKELTASVHNLYIFLRLEGGYFLLLIFLLLFFLIWRKIRKYINEYDYIYFSSYIIAIMLRISFDVTFLANNFGQSIALWLPILFMLNKCQNENINKQKLKGGM